MVRSFSGSLGCLELQQHVLRTYFIVRIGIAAIGITFPFILLFGGLWEHICPQGSMSAYYHAVGSADLSMRNWFVGLLFAVSISLVLYRGYSRTEDLLLDAAGALGVGIAIFPMEWPGNDLIACGGPGSSVHHATKVFGYPLHEVCAISFFVCIAFVCWFCADDTLFLIRSVARRNALKWAYRAIALLMPAAMLVAWVFNKYLLRNATAVFWAEATGVVAFGVYWFIKGIELNRTAADLEAALGRLRQNAGEVEAVEEPSRPRLHHAVS